MTTVSVVIPCHNYGRFLPEAVASVEAQTRPPDEIVIVDDGSSDDTASVIEGLKTSISTRVVARSPARGPARTFNDGVRASSGELVMILSADDCISPRYVELMEAALTDKALDFAYASERLFGAQQGWQIRPPFDRDEVMVENLINGSALMRRSLFERVGGFREDFDRTGLEDWEFWVHALETGAQGCLVEGCWLEYRRHPAGSRNTFSRLVPLRVHLLVWRLHPSVMKPRHLVRWVCRSTARNLRRVLLGK